MCRLRDCSVCECPEGEFPESFKKSVSGLPHDDIVCQEGKPQAAVDRTIDTKVFRGWKVVDNPWTNDDETDNGRNKSLIFIFAEFNNFLLTKSVLLCLITEEMTYVNLLLNPERYTGYSGPSARRIWDAVYAENCPKC